MMKERMNEMDGDGRVMACWIGTDPVVLLTCPVLAKKFFAMRDSTFVRKFQLPSLQELFGEGIIQASGEDWRRQHRLLQTVFTPQATASSIPYILQHTNEIIKLLKMREGAH